jgi:hypothetical protein
MDITIIITDSDEVAELVACAAENNLTKEVYASGIVSTWLRTRLIGYYKDKVASMSIEDLKQKIGSIEQIGRK